VELLDDEGGGCSCSGCWMGGPTTLGGEKWNRRTVNVVSGFGGLGRGQKRCGNRTGVGWSVDGGHVELNFGSKFRVQYVQGLQAIRPAPSHETSHARAIHPWRRSCGK
jgi:hypothetical protein